MLDTLLGGYGHGFGDKDHISSGYGYEGHNEFVSHQGSEMGHFDRQARYDHQMRLPTNHGRPSMAHMPICDEEDSDEEFYKSSRSHRTTMLPNHGSNHQQQTPHMNFMPPPTMTLPHHNGKMGNGWQGRHEDGYHGGHGPQKHGGHGMQQHGGHGMQHHDEYGMQQHGGHGMQQHQDWHSGQQHGGHGSHGMQQHGAHGMKQHGVHGMKHQDRLMGPQIPPHHVFMNPSLGSGSGHAVVVKASENWRMSNSTGGHHRAGWGSKGL